MGLNIQQAISVLIGGGVTSAGTRETANNHFQSLIISQYRNFEMLEHFLTHPKTLGTQLIFSLSLTTRISLVSSYYRIDACVCRELLGRKLTHRVRKDLDDIAFRTQRSVILCRRVFDNLKRITKRVEDAEEDMGPCIAQHFLLSEELAAQYACIIFLNHYRFDTVKRRLSLLSFFDYEYAASILLKYFPASPDSALEGLDSLIVEDCRLLKICLFNHKDVLDRLRLALLQILDPSSTLGDKCSLALFKTIIRNVLAVGSFLSNSKEIRDLFLTITERVVDVAAAQAAWSEQDLSDFFGGLVRVLKDQSGPDVFSGAVKYVKTFTRLFTAIQLISLRFMTSLSKATE